ncbi:MAG: hypothetical protein MdMp024_0048 [Bacteroidales bacterium]
MYSECTEIQIVIKTVKEYCLTDLKATKRLTTLEVLARSIVVRELRKVNATSIAVTYSTIAEILNCSHTYCVYLNSRYDDLTESNKRYKTLANLIATVIKARRKALFA